MAYTSTSKQTYSLQLNGNREATRKEVTEGSGVLLEPAQPNFHNKKHKTRF